MLYNNKAKTDTTANRTEAPKTDDASEDCSPVVDDEGDAESADDVTPPEFAVDASPPVVAEFAVDAAPPVVAEFAAVVAPPVVAEFAAVVAPAVVAEFAVVADDGSHALYKPSYRSSTKQVREGSGLFQRLAFNTFV